MRPPCPCHECKDRVLGCHNRCPQYAIYTKANDQQKEDKKHQVNGPMDALSFTIERYEHRRKCHKNGRSCK